MPQTNHQDILDIDIKAEETDRKGAYPNIKFTAILFFTFILNTFIVAIPGIIIFISLPNNLPILRSLLKLMLYIAPILLTINHTVKKSKKQQGHSVRVNFDKIQGWLVPLIIIGTLALVMPIEQVSTWMPMPFSVQKIFEKTFTKDIFSIGTVVIVASIVEEILCRGIVLKGLLKNYQPHKAIMISAIFFGAIHLNPWQALPAFIGGLFIGWVYYKTQSIIPGMIIHATLNTVATSFLFLPGHQQSLLSFMGMPNYIIALLASILVFATTCVIIHKKNLQPNL